MSKQIKIIGEEYDDVLKKATITIQYGNTIVSKSAQMSKEDIEKGYPSSHLYSKDLAFYKCINTLTKKEYQELDSELKTLRNLYKTITDLKTFKDEEHKQICRHIRKQIYLKMNQSTALKQIYENNKATLELIMAQRDEDCNNYLMAMQKKVKETNESK